MRASICQFERQEIRQLAGQRKMGEKDVPSRWDCRILVVLVFTLSCDLEWAKKLGVEVIDERMPENEVWQQAEKKASRSRPPLNHLTVSCHLPELPQSMLESCLFEMIANCSPMQFLSYHVDMAAMSFQFLLFFVYHRLLRLSRYTQSAGDCSHNDGG